MPQPEDGPPHDHPGVYVTMRIPVGADALNALAEQQEAQGFKLVAYNESFITFYKDEDKH